MRKLLTVVSSCAVVGFSIACGGGPAQEAAPAEPPAAPPAAAAPEKPAEAPAAAAAISDKVDDPSFELAVTPVGTYAAGKPGSVAVTLKPRGVYHVNQDYPMSVALKAPAGITLAKAELQKAEAAEFTEKVARFDIPVTPTAAGSHKLEAHVKFAVCTPENCVPDERTLALALTVQ
jgi:hypothetical protein